MAKHSLSATLVFLALFFNVGLCGEIASQNGLSATKAKLKINLLKIYDKYGSQGSKDQSDNTQIEMSVSVQDYSIRYEYHPENIDLRAEFTLTWNDTCLKWKPEEYDMIEEIEISTEDIWAPELKPSELDLFSHIPSILDDTKCKLKYSGMVSCTADSSHTGYCESDIFKWPYNIHSCYVQYMISTKNNERVTVVISAEKDIQIYEANSGWKVINASVDIYTVESNREIFTHEMFLYFDLREDLDVEFQFFYASIFCLTSLNLFCFWINLNDSGRLLLVLMNILLHFFEVQNIEWRIPEIGHTVPYVIGFYRNSLICTFVILLETLYFKSLLKSEDAEPNYISIFHRVLNKPTIKRILLIPINKEEDAPNEIDIKYIEEVKQLAKLQKLQLLDRIMCILFYVVYFIMISVFFAL